MCYAKSFYKRSSVQPPVQFRPFSCLTVWTAVAGIFSAGKVQITSKNSGGKPKKSSGNGRWLRFFENKTVLGQTSSRKILGYSTPSVNIFLNLCLINSLNFNWQLNELSSINSRHRYISRIHVCELFLVYLVSQKVDWCAICGRRHWKNSLHPFRKGEKRKPTTFLYNCLQIYFMIDMKSYMKSALQNV